MQYRSQIRDLSGSAVSNFAKRSRFEGMQLDSPIGKREKIKEIQLLEKYQEEIQDTNYKSLSFGVWEGCLSLLRNLGSECYEIIVMKEYGVKESWRKLYTISETIARDVCDIKLVYRAVDEYEGIEVAWNQVKLYDCSSL
ncbi:hypothetical protein Syun_026603 [Stephania yunnanensis]|uniref:Uncharacterized protein n=1 Tax=Stephania yunnanensis TaxID=152371 RepID=A0AAP0EZD7_9MAGN